MTAAGARPILPLTDRARTLIDLLRTEPFGIAYDLLDRAVQQGWLSEFDLDHEIETSTGRTGNRQLKILRSGIEPCAQAESERRLHRLLRAAGIQGWRPQYEVSTPSGTRYIDVAFPEQRLAIEVEGRRAHDDRSDRFDDDRSLLRRIAQLLAA